MQFVKRLDNHVIDNKSPELKELAQNEQIFFELKPIFLNITETKFHTIQYSLLEDWSCKTFSCFFQKGHVCLVQKGHVWRVYIGWWLKKQVV